MKSSHPKPYGEMIAQDIPSCPWKVVEIDFTTHIPVKKSRILDYGLM